MLSQLLALAVLLAVGACDGDSPLAPADTPSAPAEEALGSADEPAAPDLALATTTQRILFSSCRKGSYDVFKMDPVGLNVVRLTSFAKYETEGAWSYDNKRIAMVRPRLDASNVEHSDIYLMNADGTNKHWARSSPSTFNIRYPSWSPDGSRLVVSVGSKPYLATIKLATGELDFVKSYTTLVRGLQASYDPTGKSIIFIGPTGKTVEVVNATQWYVPILSDTPVGRPNFSPDGKKFAYTRLVNGNEDIYVQTIGIINTPKRLTTYAGYDGLPTWSPDGSKIAFASSRSGKSQIWTMNAATGGSLTRITHTAVNETDPAWSH